VRAQVDVVSIEHLPKKDTFGSCDSFCRLNWAGEKRETRVIKGAYSARFEECFFYDVADAAAPAERLVLTVLDWDLGSKPDEVGSVVIDSTLMQRVVQANVGWSGDSKFEVLANGAPVQGKDAQTCCVTLKLSTHVWTSRNP
jgi:Ca2+-dependent lipid-binding protein